MQERKIPSEWVPLSSYLPRARGVRLHLGDSFKMRITRLVAIPIVVLIALAVPGVASANTGSVTCDSTGVVFSYNANFGRDQGLDRDRERRDPAVHRAGAYGHHAHVAHLRHADRWRDVEWRLDPDGHARLPVARRPRRRRSRRRPSPRRSRRPSRRRSRRPRVRPPRPCTAGHAGDSGRPGARSPHIVLKKRALDEGRPRRLDREVPADRDGQGRHRARRRRVRQAPRRT